MATKKVGTEDAITRSEFASILKENVKRFDPALGADAREAEQLQPARWKDLIRTLERALGAHLDVFAANELQAALQRSLERSKFNVAQLEGAPALRGDIPPLPDDTTGRIKAFVGQNPWFALAGILLSFGGAIQPRKDEPPFGAGIQRLLQDPRLMRSYQEWFEVAGFQPALKDSVEVIVTAARQKVAQLEQDMAWVRSLIGDAQKREQEWLAGAISARNDAIANINAAWTEFFAASVEDLEATKRRVTEQTILSNAHDLWSRKAWIHAISFGLGLFLIASVVLVGVFATIEYGPTYIAKLPRKADGEVSYISVATLTMCVIAIGWLLRFVGRYVVEHMVLQADAVQRKTMLQTYLALVGMKEAGMEQADRTLVLNAIFRPLPGHPSDDVAPPTLIEVVKGASGKG